MPSPTLLTRIYCNVYYGQNTYLYYIGENHGSTSAGTVDVSVGDGTIKGFNVSVKLNPENNYVTFWIVKNGTRLTESAISFAAGEVGNKHIDLDIPVADGDTICICIRYAGQTSSAYMEAYCTIDFL